MNIGVELLQATNQREATRQKRVRVNISEVSTLPPSSSCEIRSVSYDKLGFLEPVVLESSRGWLARRVLRVTENGIYLEGEEEPEFYSDRVYRVTQAWYRGARLTLKSRPKLKDSVAWLRSYIHELAA